MGCRVTGRLVSPSGVPQAGVLCLTPHPLVAALPAGGAVMVGPATAVTAVDGSLDVVVTAPENVAWTVQLTGPGGVHLARTGVVLPQDGDVSLAVVLGLTTTPTPGQGVVVSPDGALFTAPAVASGDVFTIEGVVSADGATFTIHTGGAADG